MNDLTRHTPAGPSSHPGRCWCGLYHLRILICGSRDWTDGVMIARRVVELPPGTVVIEGEARGADTLARWCAEACGLEVAPYEADWKKYGLAAGPIRNRLMLVDGMPHEVWAFHDNLRLSRGTWDMVTRARKAGVPVKVIGHYDKNKPLGGVNKEEA